MGFALNQTASIPAGYGAAAAESGSTAAEVIEVNSLLGLNAADLAGGLVTIGAAGVVLNAAAFHKFYAAVTSGQYSTQQLQEFTRGIAKAGGQFGSMARLPALGALLDPRLQPGVKPLVLGLNRIASDFQLPPRRVTREVPGARRDPVTPRSSTPAKPPDMAGVASVAQSAFLAANRPGLDALVTRRDSALAGLRQLSSLTGDSSALSARAAALSTSFAHLGERLDRAAVLTGGLAVLRKFPSLNGLADADGQVLTRPQFAQRLATVTGEVGALGKQVARQLDGLETALGSEQGRYADGRAARSEASFKSTLASMDARIRTAGATQGSNAAVVARLSAARRDFATASVTYLGFDRAAERFSSGYTGTVSFEGKTVGRSQVNDQLGEARDQLQTAVDAFDAAAASTGSRVSLSAPPVSATGGRRELGINPYSTAAGTLRTVSAPDADRTTPPGVGIADDDTTLRVNRPVDEAAEQLRPGAAHTPTARALQDIEQALRRQLGTAGAPATPEQARESLGKALSDAAAGHAGTSPAARIADLLREAGLPADQSLEIGRFLADEGDGKSGTPGNDAGRTPSNDGGSQGAGPPPEPEKEGGFARFNKVVLGAGLQALISKVGIAAGFGGPLLLLLEFGVVRDGEVASKVAHGGEEWAARQEAGNLARGGKAGSTAEELLANGLRDVVGESVDVGGRVWRPAELARSVKREFTGPLENITRNVERLGGNTAGLSSLNQQAGRDIDALLDRQLGAASRASGDAAPELKALRLRLAQELQGEVKVAVKAAAQVPKTSAPVIRFMKPTAGAREALEAEQALDRIPGVHAYGLKAVDGVIRGNVGRVGWPNALGLHQPLSKEQVAGINRVIQQYEHNIYRTIPDSPIVLTAQEVPDAPLYRPSLPGVPASGAPMRSTTPSAVRNIELTPATSGEEQAATGPVRQPAGAIDLNLGESVEAKATLDSLFPQGWKAAPQPDGSYEISAMAAGSGQAKNVAQAFVFEGQTVLIPHTPEWDISAMRVSYARLSTAPTPRAIADLGQVLNRSGLSIESRYRAVEKELSAARLAGALGQRGVDGLKFLCASKFSTTDQILAEAKAYFYANMALRNEMPEALAKNLLGPNANAFLEQMRGLPPGSNQEYRTVNRMLTMDRSKTAFPGQPGESNVEFQRHLRSLGIEADQTVLPGPNQKFIFRSDTRDRETIFADGFFPRSQGPSPGVGSRAEAMLYTLSPSHAADSISYSRKPGGVMQYLRTDGMPAEFNIYVVANDHPSTTDLGRMLGDGRSRHRYEELITQKGGQPGTKVLGVIRGTYEREKGYTFNFTRNPGYSGPLPVSRRNAEGR